MTRIRNVVLYSLAAFWFGVILACGSPQRTARGEPTQGAAEDMFRRCMNVIEPIQCRSRSFVCIRNITNGYYALESYAERQQYLILNGCPEAMAR